MTKRRARSGTPTKTALSWQDWKSAIWDQLAGLRIVSGLAALEQYMKRSAAEQRCVECGEPGTVERQSVLVKSVSAYWFCSECARYWADRAVAEKAS